MPSKTPWPNPLSGFAEGLESGTKMGLLRRQQNLAEQESLAKAAEAEAKAKREDIAAKFAAAKELQGVRHPAIQKARLNMYATTVKKNAEYFGIDPSAIPDNIEWNDDFTIPLKELDSAFEAWEEGKISDSQGLQALRETMTKMSRVMDSADVEKLRAEKEKQFGEMQQGRALQGASDISTRMRMNPDLVAQTDPAVLEFIESERMRLLTKGGTAGQAQWQKGMEGAEGGAGKSRTPFELQVFEATRGWSPKDRGTSEYQEDFMQYISDKVTARGKGKEELSLSPAETQGMINPITLEKIPYGTTREEAQVMGAIKVPQKTMDVLLELGTTENLIEQLDALTRRIITAPDAASAAIQGIELKAGAFAKTNDTAAAYSDQKAAFLGVISRTMGGERGVLTDRDIERIEKSLPAFRDTKNIRDYKMNALKQILGYSKELARRKMLGGEIPPTERNKINGLLDALEGKKPLPDLGNYREDTKKSNPSGGKSKEVTFNPQTGRFE